MECEVTAKTYEQLEVIPGAARLIGEVERFNQSHGFYITALTAAMLLEDPLGVSQPMTLITGAENVKVVKAAGQTWAAGQWVYWDEGSSNFTTTPASDRFCVGKAQRLAANSAVVGYIVFQDNYHPVQLGTTAVPISIAAGRVFDIHVTSSQNSGGNVEPFVLETILTGVGATGGRALFKMSTEVALGGWANALKSIVELGVAGRVTGLLSGFCAELVAAETAPPGGNYVALEAELVMPSGAGVGAGMAYMYCNVQGAAKATFQGAGYFAIIDNAGDASDGFFYDTSNGTTDAWLRWRINGTDYYMMLSLVATEA